jgi:hypothetical protein
MNCGQQDFVRWDSEYRQVEQEANTFAAYLLMPLDDFRRQIPARDVATFESLSDCAGRYQVSLIAATLRWLSYTERRSVLVVSRDDYILWARSSQPALKSGIFIKTAGLPPIEVPTQSVARLPTHLAPHKTPVAHDPGVWFMDPCQETVLASENYDFKLSLIQLASSSGCRAPSEANDDEPEGLDRQLRRLHGLE